MAAKQITQNLFKKIVDQATHQFTTYTPQSVAVPYLTSHFQKLETDTSDKKLAQQGEAVLSYLQSTRKHQELLEAYASPISEDQKIEATAKRVGLQLPKLFTGEETENKQ
ncbi:hypothetical protein CONCODRAFT_85232 [Conidiobolus coronatus NRRL 28638]|uniref:Uncharacterized protein n=1 Tax=Conidiobolus coronatus (strain ATCC 28846 / CBS 209.66 / NRRL 28638) TaxID=796925 RepID=A0A137P697_CONC2|nr:hypothetical protein CONCODRAFT_85232 [Conidiobolus coronatus NRRL 28638]|eukprot:KXN70530.1 hypothetical protein CONCODRAFT_85232 [Conidiobolus coronatus NRRL 28638]